MSTGALSLRRQRTAPWIERLTIEHLAVAVFLATNLYSIFGLPTLDRDAVVDTDYVSPINRYIWFGLLAASLPVLRQRWAETLQLLRAIWPLLLMFAYFALSMSWAIDPSASLRRNLFSLLQLALMVILLAGIRRGPLAHVVLALACCVVALADVGIGVAAPGYAMTDEGFAGFQLQKNVTGLIMMYGCLATGSALFLLRRWRSRLGLAAATLLMFAILLASRSTTSTFVVMIMPALIPFVLWLARLSNRAVTAVLLTIATALAMTVFVYFAWCAVIGADPWLPLRGVTFTGRLEIWEFVVDEIAKRPWFGAGYGSFWAINPAVQPSLQQTTWFAIYTIINEGHDGFLDLLATGGVIGFMIGVFVMLRGIGIAFAAIRRARSTARAWSDGGLAFPTAVFHMSVLLGLVVHNSMESNFFSNQAPLAVALLLTLIDLDKWRVQTGRGWADPWQGRR